MLEACVYVLFISDFIFIQGVELSDKDPLAQFEVDETDKEVTVQQLIIKQISLGAEAKSGEFNVVQVSCK